MTPPRKDSEGPADTPSIDQSKSDLYAQLDDYELSWIRRQPWLQSRGYMLRPRYRPGWIPSWKTTGARPINCEDAIQIGVCGVAL